MDEAFVPLAELVPELLPAVPDLYDEDAGVRTWVTGYEVDTPVELAIGVRPDGTVELGASPPIYHVATAQLPVFHSIRVVAVREEVP
ncbi:MAG TPA: hypothetical protein DEQ43_26030 [Nocardioides bacterium]|uniref:hypothetical protein n=1 Tax=uncultured Nocardioides sp. TaxID=198441 RepID=UPI000EDAB624|nr:hypothetical protein [uncultured Nocardioides sp.]HCB07670.1 hypothetical protein [Nocardioides sp.]HRD64190.1 hypothetical protein [Nocardioides sp.]